MPSETRAVQLTPLQISHAAVAVQLYMKSLLDAEANDPQGGEHEDYLIAQSILRQLAATGE
jgi:hypothetical protein